MIKRRKSKHFRLYFFLPQGDIFNSRKSCLIFNFLLIPISEIKGIGGGLGSNSEFFFFGIYVIVPQLNFHLKLSCQRKARNPIIGQSCSKIGLFQTLFVIFKNFHFGYFWGLNPEKIKKSKFFKFLGFKNSQKMKISKNPK